MQSICVLLASDSFESNQSATAERRRKIGKNRESRYTEAYGPHEGMINIDGINIHTKTLITCNENLVGKIYVDRKEHKMRSIGHCAMLEEGAMHLGTKADVSAYALDTNGKTLHWREDWIRQLS